MDQTVFSFTPEPEYRPRRGEEVSFSAIGVSPNPVRGKVRSISASRIQLRLAHTLTAAAGSLLIFEAGSDMWFDLDLIGKIHPITSPINPDKCTSEKE